MVGFGARSALSVILALASPGGACLADEITILAPGAYKAALDEIAPAFEASSGHKVRISYAPSAVIAKKVEGGEVFDVAITSPDALGNFARGGKVLAQPLPVIGENAVMIAYRKGERKPDVSSPEALRKSLLDARAISFSDPEAGGSSSNYFLGVVKQLGIEKEVRAKAVVTKPAEGAHPVASGEAEIGVAQTSEVAMAKAVEAVRLNPLDPKSSSLYAAGVAAASAHQAAGKSFIEFVTSARGLEIRRAKGLAS